MRKLKSKLVIEFKVEPLELFKTMMDEDGKQIRESFCTKIAKACIDSVQSRIYQYIDKNIIDEQDELAYDAVEEVGVNPDMMDLDKGFSELVKSFRITMESKKILFSDIDLVKD